MKLVDDKGRLFGLINVFDLLVLLGVLAIIAAVGYKLAERGAESGVEAQTKTWIAMVKCPSMPLKFSEALMKDTRVYYETDGFVNAKILKTTEEDASVVLAAPDGTVAVGKNPSLKDVYVQLEIRDDTSDAAIKVGRYAVCVGGKLTVKTIYAAALDGVVVDLYPE